MLEKVVAKLNVDSAKNIQQNINFVFRKLSIYRFAKNVVFLGLCLWTENSVILTSTELQTLSTIVSRPCMKSNKNRKSCPGFGNQIYSFVIEVEYFLPTVSFHCIFLHR